MTTADERAQRDLFTQMMQQRRTQLGYPPTGGFGGRGPRF
jgi:hypothetical protein